MSACQAGDTGAEFRPVAPAGGGGRNRALQACHSHTEARQTPVQKTHVSKDSTQKGVLPTQITGEMAGAPSLALALYYLHAGLIWPYVVAFSEGVTLLSEADAMLTRSAITNLSKAELADRSMHFTKQ